MSNLASRESIWARLRRGKKTRERFVESHIDKTVAFQLRSLRGDASQESIAKLTGIGQQNLSRLENPYYGKATLTTLKRIAAAYDVALLVQFIPFSRMADWVSGTPFCDYGLSPQIHNVPSFDEEDVRAERPSESPAEPAKEPS